MWVCSIALLLLLLLSHFSRVRLCNPIDGSLPGSPIRRILQARTLEWVAISFSNAWKWKVKVKSLSRVRLNCFQFSSVAQLCPTLCDPMNRSTPGLPVAQLCPAQLLYWKRTSLVAQTVKRLPTMRETWVRSLGREDPLEKEMATHSSILAWRIPWME